MKKNYRLWVNEQRTVLVTLWDSGLMTVATRENDWRTWGPPIPVIEES